MNQVYCSDCKFALPKNRCGRENPFGKAIGHSALFSAWQAGFTSALAAMKEKPDAAE